jgi:hypothetical protein
MEKAVRNKINKREIESRTGRKHLPSRHVKMRLLTAWRSM